ncbi:hypothetical protein ACFSVK_00675 [Azorhizophilus paspali]|uniref:hypothetical protein n=1 Tax=Azorhizophilus paspali TaxID=69963 RepID=UPI00363C3FA9
MSLAQLQTCAQGNTTARRVVDDQARAAVVKGIDATPTLELKEQPHGPDGTAAGIAG